MPVEDRTTSADERARRDAAGLGRLYIHYLEGVLGNNTAAKRSWLGPGWEERKFRGYFNLDRPLPPG